MNRLLEAMSISIITKEISMRIYTRRKMLEGLSCMATGVALLSSCSNTSSQSGDSPVRNRSTPAQLRLPDNARFLFIGNSYTEFNQLDSLVAQILKDLGETTGRNDRVTPNGYTLSRHAQDLQTPASSTYQALRGSDKDWAVVVLQEQSQLPGFPPEQREYTQMMQAAETLHRQIGAMGAETALLMTWGYAMGDPRNRQIFPDFSTMQTRLAEGIDAMAVRLSQSGRIPRVIPVGDAFHRVYDDTSAPLEDGSRFLQLYDPRERAHPSLAGSFLAACVVAASYSSRSITERSWSPLGLDRDSAVYLRQIAQQTVNPG